MDTEEFIEKAKKKHGDKYNYLKTIYNGYREYVCIICPEHGEFWQRACNHLKGYGCKKCQYEKIKGRGSNAEEFIEKARAIHGDKYDYSKVEYTNNHTKVCIICPEHGEFWQTPNTHLDKHGCPKCKSEISRQILRSNAEEFIEKARAIHGDKYDYSKVEYTNNHTKVCIICPEHGEFWQTPHSHLNGRGCKTCANELASKRYRLSQNIFLGKARAIHGDKYDYSKVEYKGHDKKICLICPEHGEFYIKANDVLNGHGCAKCSGNYKSNSEEFIKKAQKVHGDKYNYSKVEYINNQTKVCIICPEHGEFWQSPLHHLSNHGCPKCNSSKMELEIIRLLEENGIEYEYNLRYKFIDKLQLDFYIPLYKIAIECQGEQHFYPVGFGEKDTNKVLKKFKKNCFNDNKKRELCKENGIKLLYYSIYDKINDDFIIKEKNKILDIIKNEASGINKV